MKILITFLTVLGFACAAPGFFDDVAEVVSNGATAFVNGASNFIQGALNYVTDDKEPFGNIGRNGKIEYISLFEYYNEVGINIFPNFGGCSCPRPGIVQPGNPNYSSDSPFFFNGVYKIHGTEFCTCPPELVAVAVQAAHYKPELLGDIGEYVLTLPQVE